MATCNYIPSKLNSLEKAEITQTTLKDHDCFIAEENAKPCVWAGITLHNSRMAGQLASKQLGCFWRCLWVNLQCVLAAHGQSCPRHCYQQCLPSPLLGIWENALAELQPVWSSLLKEIPWCAELSAAESYQSGHGAGEHLRLCRVRLRELGLSSIKKGGMMGAIIAVFTTWGIQRRWKMWPKRRHLGKWLE